MLWSVDLMIEEAKQALPILSADRTVSRQIRLVFGEIYRAHMSGEVVSPSHLAAITGTSLQNIRIILRRAELDAIVRISQEGRSRRVTPSQRLVNMYNIWVEDLIAITRDSARSVVKMTEKRRAFLAMHGAGVKTEDLRLNHLLRSTHGRGLCCLLYRNFKRRERDLSVNDVLEALPVSHETVRLMKKDLIDMEMVSQFKRGRRTYLHPTEYLITEVDAYLARVAVYVDLNMDNFGSSADLATVVS